jgi:glycosyltransferase involved in cell wall biosynthesis
MPSKFETFGLAYIEAMTQGLPVVFTKNQGIDGYFKAGEIGVAVENNNIENLILGIHEILNNYKFMSNNCLKHSKSFSWDIISLQYLVLYNSLI